VLKQAAYRLLAAAVVDGQACGSSGYAEAAHGWEQARVSSRRFFSRSRTRSRANPGCAASTRARSRRLALRSSLHSASAASRAARSCASRVFPFPSNLVPQGFITFNAQEVYPQVAFDYLLLDFGGRAAAVEAAKQLSIAGNADFTAAIATRAQRAVSSAAVVGA
jgi:hypothetical protein